MADARENKKNKIIEVNAEMRICEKCKKKIIVEYKECEVCRNHV